MSLSAMLFGQDSAIHKVTNILGLGIPGLLHKSFMPSNPKMAAQTLGELSSQTAKEGDPRPIVYGIGRPIGGNIMYMSQPIKRMVKTYVGKAGGKGGGKKKKQYQDVEHVYRYYAIRVCEGPISGFRRIWRNGALVYDGRKGSAWGAKNNHLFFKTYRLYTGSWTQTPDSVLQARQGMNIPAYRGTAYLVANNEDLTDFGGAVPQWQFEVARSEGYYLTSRPYAFEDEPSSGAFAVSAKESPSTHTHESSGTSGVAILGGQSSGTWKQSHVDEMNATGWVDSITMTRTTRYSSMDAGVEQMNATGWVDSITMTRTTRYSDYIVEPHEMDATGWVDSIIMTRTSGEVPPQFSDNPALWPINLTYQGQLFTDYFQFIDNLEMRAGFYNSVTRINFQYRGSYDHVDIGIFTTSSGDYYHVSFSTLWGSGMTPLIYPTLPEGFQLIQYGAEHGEFIRSSE